MKPPKLEFVCYSFLFEMSDLGCEHRVIKVVFQNSMAQNEVKGNYCDSCRPLICNYFFIVTDRKTDIEHSILILLANGIKFETPWYFAQYKNINTKQKYNKCFHFGKAQINKRERTRCSYRVGDLSFIKEYIRPFLVKILNKEIAKILNRLLRKGSCTTALYFLSSCYIIGYYNPSSGLRDSPCYVCYFLSMSNGSIM